MKSIVNKNWRGLRLASQTVRLGVCWFLALACVEIAADTRRDANQIIPNPDIATHLCLDAAWGGTSNGTKIQQWGCNATVAQDFVIYPIQNSQSMIYHPASEKCLDVAGASRDNGAPIQLWECNGTNAQRFYITRVGQNDYTIRNINSNKCWDIDSWHGAWSAKLQQWECNFGQKNQIFFLKQYLQW